MKKVLMAALLCTSLQYVAVGQESQADNPWSKVDFYTPEAASLMKYVDYPVSPSTGIPDITIPLHTIQSGSLEFPINLSFHTDNFITFGQLPGVAGAGWSLSSEIMITKKINGAEDITTKGIGGYLKNTNIPDSFTYGSSRNITDDYLAKKLTDNYGNYDEEPDKYYYSLLGGQRGAFYSRGNGGFNAVTVPLNGVIIVLDGNMNFTIIDESGNKYYFDVKDYEEKNYIRTYLNWKCSRIESASGADVITFSYTANTIKKVISRNDKIEVYDDYIGTSVYTPPSYLPAYYCEPGAKMIDAHTWIDSSGGGFLGETYSYYRRKAVNLTGEPIFSMEHLNIFNTGANTLETFPKPAVMETKDITIHDLTKISFRGGEAVFSYKDHGRKQPSVGSELTALQVYNSDNIQILYAYFTQQFESDPGTTSSYYYPSNSYTRQLESLFVNGGKYTFQYGCRHRGGLNWTPDGWGACIHASKNNPWMVTSHDIWIVDHEYTTVYGQPTKFTHRLGGGGDPGQWIVDSLKLLTIGYPTGGRVEFIVENNKSMITESYGEDGSHNYERIGDIGGLRIERIDYFDTDNSLVKQKIYKYGIAEDGIGYTKFDIVVNKSHGGGSSFMTEQRVKLVDMSQGHPRVYDAGRLRTYRPNMFQKVQFDTGSPVVYEEVAEYDSSQGDYTGKTVYKYKIDKYAYRSWYLSDMEPTSSDPNHIEREEWDIVQQDSIIMYKYGNGCFEWVKRVKYEYNTYIDPIQIFCGRIQDPDFVIFGCDPAGYSYGLADYYRWAGYYHIPAQKFYRYAGLHTGCMQLVRETTEEMADNGVVITATTEYEYDDDYGAPYRAIASTKSTSDGNSITTQTLYPQNYAAGGFISTLLAKNMVAAPVETIVRRNGKIISGSYFSYDSNGNVAGVYKLEESNIAESSFRLSNKSTAGSYRNTREISFYPDSRYKLNTSITYHAVNNKPVQVTDKAGRSVTYLWGYNGRYPIAEIQNATFSKVETALGGASAVNNVLTGNSPSTAQWNALNGLRANPELSDAVVTLYKYLPLFGISEIINPRGGITNYGYDPHGRLTIIDERENQTAAPNALQFFEYNYRNQ